MRDLIIAGGGPVGLAAGLYAARAGLDVEIREPRDGTIDKACGEGLMPGALSLLTDLGVDPPGHLLRGIRYVDDTHEAGALFRHGPGRGVRRTALHGSLRHAVDMAGIPVTPRPVRAVTQDTRRVLVDGDPAAYVLAADGLHSPVRRLLGLDVSTRGERRFGQRAHIATAPWSDCVEVHWSSGAEAYVTPVADDLIGIAVLSSRTGSLTEHLAGLPSLRARLADHTLVGTRGAGPLRQRSRRRVAGRVLLAGDAAGYVDALTGEGVASGLAQARAAVAAIATGHPDSYERGWRRLTWRHDLLTQALLSSTRHPAPRRHLVRAAAALPWAFDAAVNQLARPA
ncbi:NAD(P)/FAD-dependent oxidoreductase [Aeromicrobium sp. CF3.5]|uniref:NAD(P)/FAD-dependent oxidoreductase n=1 Tax=Aeromicrobium sp. CF3.5 TaxID=3373078 RepID=UPI003EE4A778